MATSILSTCFKQSGRIFGTLKLPSGCRSLHSWRLTGSTIKTVDPRLKRPLGGLFLSSNTSARFNSTASTLSQQADCSYCTSGIGDVHNLQSFSNLTDLSDSIAVSADSIHNVGLGSYYTPAGWVENFLEYLHLTLDIPWWGAIALATVTFRLCLFPIFIKIQRNGVNLSNNMPEYQRFTVKVNEARLSGNKIAEYKAQMEFNNWKKEKNVSLLKIFTGPLTQAPIFVSMFWGLRAMATTPVESMKMGGLLWFTDLTLKDPYFVLPCLVSATTGLMLALGTETGGVSTIQRSAFSKYFMYAMPILMLPFISKFPAGLGIYWVFNSLYSLIQMLIVTKIKPIRKFLKIPDRVVHSPSDLENRPDASMMEKWKKFRDDEKIRRMVLDRNKEYAKKVQESATGTVRKTYNYDPTEKLKPK